MSKSLVISKLPLTFFSSAWILVSYKESEFLESKVNKSLIHIIERILHSSMKDYEAISKKENSIKQINTTSVYNSLVKVILSEFIFLFFFKNILYFIYSCILFLVNM